MWDRMRSNVNTWIDVGRQEIDGDAFLMLTQADLVKVLGLKLGPALKIYNCIILLRQKVVSL